MNRTVRDNSWAFGLGMAILSIPTTFLIAGHLPRQSYSELLHILGVGFGLVVACKLAYKHTQALHYFTERIVIMAAMSLGLAFLLASAALSHRQQEADSYPDADIDQEDQKLAPEQGRERTEEQSRPGKAGIAGLFEPRILMS